MVWDINTLPGIILPNWSSDMVSYFPGVYGSGGWHNRVFFPELTCNKSSFQDLWRCIYEVDRLVKMNLERQIASDYHVHTQQGESLRNLWRLLGSEGGRCHKEPRWCSGSGLWLAVMRSVVRTPLSAWDFGRFLCLKAELHEQKHGTKRRQGEILTPETPLY